MIDKKLDKDQRFKQYDKMGTFHSFNENFGNNGTQFVCIPAMIRLDKISRSYI